MQDHKKRVVVVGAGVAGLVSASTLASRGFEVTVVERAACVGGKIRQVQVGHSLIDSGPTVFTMRDLFEYIFDDAGANLNDYINIEPLDILARHAWDSEQKLDLFADRNKSADAISTFSNKKNGESYLAFCKQTEKMFNALDKTFIRSQRPNVLSLTYRTGSQGLSNLLHIKPFSTMWSSLLTFFDDERLQQLFGRYATYCGSSPYLSPATLMLIAHVEQNGVWSITGGMQELANALYKLALSHNVNFLFDEEVVSINKNKKKVCSVTLSNEEQIACDAVICNADVAAIKTGNLGEQVKKAVSNTASTNAKRSLSAITWSLDVRKNSYPLVRHNVFFSNDYKLEFEELFKLNQPPSEPTIYVCAQDRDTKYNDKSKDFERIFCLINAPANGDVHTYGPEEIEACTQKTFSKLQKCGLEIKTTPSNCVITTPTNFAQLFPQTGGALYGQATHGWKASFQRPGSRSKIPGLYLAGGSVHPGAGVPMAAMSGLLAAQSLICDLSSTAKYHPVDTLGGMQTP
jgi:1-hydroxycarotenoid 3,4-desaturase